MIVAEVDGVRMTDDELVTMCALLLAAGNVTTTDLIGNGTLALLRNPDQLRKLRDDPSLIKNAVEEMLRYDSPVTETARIPLDGAEIRGCPIGAARVGGPGARRREPRPRGLPGPAPVRHHARGHAPPLVRRRRPLLPRRPARAARSADRAERARAALPRPSRLSDAPLEYRRIPGFRGLQRLTVQTGV